MSSIAVSTKGRRISDQFWKVAIEYYASGRQATLSALGLIAGNIFHHAVEFFLKGELAKDEDYKTFKMKYCHNLSKMWGAVKAKFPGENLGAFDALIDNLHRFEDIRYPNIIIELGAFISFGFGPPAKRGGPNASTSPEFHLDVREVDALFARMFPLFRMNPPFYMPMDPAAVNAIKERNQSASDTWFR